MSATFANADDIVLCLLDMHSGDLEESDNLVRDFQKVIADVEPELKKRLITLAMSINVTRWQELNAARRLAPLSQQAADATKVLEGLKQMPTLKSSEPGFEELISRWR